MAIWRFDFLIGKAIYQGTQAFNGNAMTPEAVKNVNMVFDGDKLTLTLPNGAKHELTYKLDPGKNPKELEMVDVEILGHIFEQSISDLKRIHDKLEGRTRDDEPSKGRRKKEGAFYTPAFITRYIVAQTLGPVIRERFAALQARVLVRSRRTHPSEEPL